MDGLGAAISAGLAFAAAGLFVAVARKTAFRTVSASSAVPNRAYAAAWVCIAVMIASDGVRFFLAAVVLHVPLYVAMMQAKILAMAGMLAAFGIYVLYLYRGSLRGRGYLVAFAVVHAVYFLYGLQARMPMDVVVGRWGGRAEFVGEGELLGGLVLGLGMFFLPLLGLALAYGALVRRVPGSKRRRVRSVAIVLVMFSVAGSVQANPEVSPDSLVLPIAGAALLGVAIIAWRAFRDPAVKAHVGMQT